MVDTEGKELEVGDEVISVNGGRYGTLYKWTISSFTPKGVRLLNTIDGYKNNRLCMNGDEIYKINKNS